MSSKTTVEKVEKAFGGCKLCYGKGYSTNVAYGNASGILFCKCDRGKQLEKIWNEKPCCGHGCCCNLGRKNG